MEFLQEEARLEPGYLLRIRLGLRTTAVERNHGRLIEADVTDPGTPAVRRKALVPLRRQDRWSLERTFGPDAAKPGNNVDLPVLRVRRFGFFPGKCGRDGRC